MLKSYREAVCWLARTEGGVLVVTVERARLVDQVHYHNEGLSLQAAHALTNDQRRALWFDTEADGSRIRMRLNADGEMYHRQLVARRECACWTQVTR
jgi:hypothetical protein